MKYNNMKENTFLICITVRQSFSYKKEPRPKSPQKVFLIGRSIVFWNNNCPLRYFFFTNKTNSDAQRFRSNKYEHQGRPETWFSSTCFNHHKPFWSSIKLDTFNTFIFHVGHWHCQIDLLLWLPGSHGQRWLSSPSMMLGGYWIVGARLAVWCKVGQRSDHFI